jgi:hypothetical protein
MDPETTLAIDKTPEEDLANFDEPASTAPADATPGGDPPATPADGSTPPAADAGGAEDPALLEAVAAGGDTPFIPKARFDEATGQLKDDLRETRGRLEVLEAQQAAALAPLGDPKDYKAERNALKDKYDNGLLEDDEYTDAREALLIEEAEYKAHARFALAQAESQRISAQQAWETRRDAWMGKHSDMLSVDAIRTSVDGFMQRAQKDPELSKLSDDALLAKAEEHMNSEVARLRKLLMGEPSDKSGDTTPPAPADPHAARNAKDATAQAAASSVPDPAASGAGDRGRKTFPGVKGLADKDFNALPKDVREAPGLASGW